MNDEVPFPKYSPKGEVLRRAAQRYPDLQASAIEVFMAIKRVTADTDCANRLSLEPFGLSEGKFYVLMDLFSADLLEQGAPSPSEIAEHLGVTRATMTGLLDGLERDGFLERRHDSYDRRALTIHMTEKARRFVDEYIPVSSRGMCARMSRLSEPEVRTLIALLAKIDAPEPENLNKEPSSSTASQSQP